MAQAHLEDQTPTLLQMLLQGVFEHECFVAMLTTERVLGRVAEHVTVQFVLGFGPMRAFGAGVRTIRVAGDLVQLELTLTREALVAHGTTFGSSPMDLPVKEEVVLCGKIHLTLLAIEDFARI